MTDRNFPFSRERPMHPPAEADLLRQTEPVARVKLWNGQHAWLLSRYDDIRDAFQDDQLSADSTRAGISARDSRIGGGSRNVAELHGHG